MRMGPNQSSHPPTISTMPIPGPTGKGEATGCISSISSDGRRAIQQVAVGGGCGLVSDAAANGNRQGQASRDRVPTPSRRCVEMGAYLSPTTPTRPSHTLDACESYPQHIMPGLARPHPRLAYSCSRAPVMRACSPLPQRLHEAPTGGGLGLVDQG